MTAPYKVKTKDGDFIQDEVLLSKLNPQNLYGQEEKIFGHELYFLNSHYRKEQTPQRYKDWLDLIYESINNPENPTINISNKGIKKASELINKDMLTNEERTLMKEYEGRKVVLRNEKEEGILEGKNEEKKSTVINGNKKGLSNELLSELTDLSIKEIEEIISSMR